MTVVDVDKLLERALGQGFRVVSPYIKASGLVVAAAGSAAGPVATDVLAETLAGGAGLFITDAWLYNIDGVGLDFLQWYARSNNAALEGMDAMPGAPIAGILNVPLDAIFLPGVKATLGVQNYSGGVNYPAAMSPRVQAMWKGYRFASIPGGGL